MADKVYRSGEFLVFHCPGCGCGHRVRVIGVGAQWKWNGSTSVPSLTPSILVASGHYIVGRTKKDKCWCTYNAERPDAQASFACSRCHSFVTDGKIRFLLDSTHRLAGQTIDLPDCDLQEHNA